MSGSGGVLRAFMVRTACMYFPVGLPNKLILLIMEVSVLPGPADLQPQIKLLDNG